MVPGFLQNMVLPKATLNLTRHATRLTVNYRFGTRDSLLRPLLQGDLDFAIVGLEDDENSDKLESRPLLQDRNAIVVSTLATNTGTSATSLTVTASSFGPSFTSGSFHAAGSRSSWRCWADELR